MPLLFEWPNLDRCSGTNTRETLRTKISATAERSSKRVTISYLNQTPQAMQLAISTCKYLRTFNAQQYSEAWVIKKSFVQVTGAPTINSVEESAQFHSICLITYLPFLQEQHVIRVCWLRFEGTLKIYCATQLLIIISQTHTGLGGKQLCANLFQICLLFYLFKLKYLLCCAFKWVNW